MRQLLSDAELLYAIKEGDTSAFKTLYDRYWEPIYLKACQRVDKDEAKDLVQEIMTTLWRRRNDLFTFEDGEIGRYLFTALKYRVISHYAYSAARIRNSDLLERSNDLHSSYSLETKELAAFIENEIDRLPSRMRQVFRMSREYQFSIAEIARRLGLSEQTVKNQLTEALKRLRVAIKAHDSGDWMFLAFVLFYYSHI